ncbi:Region found in RelA / SpoT proteins [uncultured archaeon]|nr:Region found in RelA / SpoT proteins [uncultured archaeon]
MKWETTRFSREEINKAGRVLCSYSATEDEKNEAMIILDNWRASHSYPMTVFQMTLRIKSRKVDKDALVAQRLKRVPAIIFKLKRSYHGRRPSMKLYQMQDIGGCRAILQTVNMARRLYEEHYVKGDLKHKLVANKDYVAEPKDDGYRSFHLVYEYKSHRAGKKKFNGLRTEVQIRSKIQHIWATAVETTGLFTRQAIKSNEGSKEWNDFFRLMSSALARLEGCPSVSNTPTDERELYLEVKRLERKLNVIKLMNGWRKAINVFNQAARQDPKFKFFLLQLDIQREILNVFAYTKNEEGRAIEEYSRYEQKNNGQKEFDVVLVGIDNVKDLKKAYPNYFVDTNEFLRYLTAIVNKY